MRLASESDICLKNPERWSLKKKTYKAKPQIVTPGHDKTTDPWNPVTWCNPYSHVVIYIGHKEGVHEVVHVTKSNGLAMGKIVKEDIFDVIKPDEQVFLGHTHGSCRLIANLREKIAKRA